MAFQFAKRVSVRWRLLGFIFCLLLFIALSGTGGLLGMRDTKHSLSLVYNNDVKPIEELRQLDELLEDTVSNSVDKVLDEELTWSEATKRVKATTPKLEKKINELIAAANKNAGGADNWLSNDISILDNTKTMVMEILAVLQENDPDQLQEFSTQRLDPFLEDFDLKIDNLISDRIAAVQKEYERSEKRYSWSKGAFWTTILVGVCVALSVGFFLMQSINDLLYRLTKAINIMMKGDLTHKLEYDINDEFGVLIEGFNQMTDYLEELVVQIRHSGIQVTSSITDIAASTRQQEATANEHAITVSEIAASTNQIAATSANLMTTMKKVNSLTKNAAEAAENGHAGLVNIDDTMVQMEKSTGSIVNKLSVLSEKADDIAGVVKTINKLADQTNLLSLNAAIEAEKAGEYGMGFSVVATEIRRLADQTAVATYDIEQMVQGVQSAVSSAVMGIDKFAKDVRVSVENIRHGSEKMEVVIERVQILKPHVTAISDGIEAQSLGAKQISEATSQINSAAQQGAESIRQVGQTIERLQQAAQGLQKAVSKFKVE